MKGNERGFVEIQTYSGMDMNGWEAALKGKPQPKLEKPVEEITEADKRHDTNYSSG